RPQRAERARAPAAVLGAVRLGAVLDDWDAAVRGEREHAVHVAALAVEMDGHNRPRSRAERTLERGQIDRRRGGLHVAQNGGRARTLDGGYGRHARVRLRDHLVAGADTERAQGELDRVSAGRDAGG